MGWDDFIANRTAISLQQHGQAVTYHPPKPLGGTDPDPVPMTGLFDETMSDVTDEDKAGDHSIRRALLDVPVEDDSGEPLEIDVSGSFTIDGQVWQIAGFGGRDDQLQTIRLKRPAHRTRRQVKSNL